MFFFFNDTATTEIYTLSLHDALPICGLQPGHDFGVHGTAGALGCLLDEVRSEEHTSELQSPCNLVCRLLLEKKNTGLVDSDLRAACSLPSDPHMSVAPTHASTACVCT